MQVNRFIRLPALLTVGIITAVLLMVTVKRIGIHENIAGYPSDNTANLSASIAVAEKNQTDRRIAIDIGLPHADMAKLQAVAAWVHTRLIQSGLFDFRGHTTTRPDVTRVTGQLVRNLPVLFTTGELHRQVAPLLSDAHIRVALKRARDSLAGRLDMDPADIRAIDPLGLRQLVLARLAVQDPIPHTNRFSGPVFSADRRHALLGVVPKDPGIEPPTARALVQFFAELEDQAVAAFGPEVTLTIAGAYPADQHTEIGMRRDFYRVTGWTALGIGILFSVAFSRVLVGILAILVPLAGVAAAVFIFSLFQDSIASMGLGLGGAIFSIAAGYGFAYLVLHSSVTRSSRWQTFREVRAAGLPAMLACLGAFLLLGSRGYGAFAQVGWLTALSIGFALVSAQAVLPIQQTGHSRPEPLLRSRFTRWTDRLASNGRPGIFVALITAAVLAGLALNTDVRVDNSISREAGSASQRIADVWGDSFSGVYLVIRAANLKALQNRNDHLLEQLETEANAGSIARPTTLSTLFPGRAHCIQNGAAWRAFWSPKRIQSVATTILREGAALGFRPQAFAPFLNMLAATPPEETDVPADILPLLAISQEKTGGWRQVIHVRPQEHFNGPRFLARLAPLAAGFSPGLLTEHMKQRLPATSLAMLLTVGAILVVVLMLFFARCGLLFIALLPLVFAITCTLGTLGIMGRALDIPALMISVGIAGLGASGTFLLIGGYQRYQRFDHPGCIAIRTALIVMAGCWLAGFAALLTAEHAALKSIGWVGCLGLGYHLMGTLLIVPPLVNRRLEKEIDGRQGIAGRYRNLEPLARLRTHFKLRRDPLCKELADLAPAPGHLANILDLGCGYGLPACWMAERYPTAVVHGIDPQAERVRITALALGSQGRIQEGAAPDLPAMDVLIDLTTMLDMSHCLQDWELEKTLERIHERLLPGGRLIMRSIVPAAAKSPWFRLEERFRRADRSRKAVYRDAHALDAILNACGFEVLTCRTSAARPHRVWHVARPK